MYQNIPIGPKAPDIFNVVIEIPKGSNNKYEYDEKLHVIKLDRVLHSPFVYPLDYGFIPETRSEDGDHLDALVIATNPLFSGCVVAVRPVGLLKMRDSGDMDEKILTVAADDPHMTNINELSGVPQGLVENIADFFASYKKPEGKIVEVLGWEEKSAALKIVRMAQEAWRKEVK